MLPIWQAKSKEDPERTTGGELHEAFAKFDTEGTGQLTLEQVVGVLTRGGSKCAARGARAPHARARTHAAARTPPRGAARGRSAEEAEAKAKELIAQYDLDGDGFLSYAEFAKAFQAERYKHLEAKGLLSKGNAPPPPASPARSSKSLLSLG